MCRPCVCCPPVRNSGGPRNSITAMRRNRLPYLRLVPAVNSRYGSHPTPLSHTHQTSSKEGKDNSTGTGVSFQLAGAVTPTPSSGDPGRRERAGCVWGAISDFCLFCCWRERKGSGRNITIARDGGRGSEVIDLQREGERLALLTGVCLRLAASTHMSPTDVADSRGSSSSSNTQERQGGGGGTTLTTEALLLSAVAAPSASKPPVAAAALLLEDTSSVSTHGASPPPVPISTASTAVQLPHQEQQDGGGELVEAARVGSAGNLSSGISVGDLKKMTALRMANHHHHHHQRLRDASSPFEHDGA